MKLNEKSNYLIGSRTSDFTACSIAPQPTTSPRVSPYYTKQSLVIKCMCERVHSQYSSWQFYMLLKLKRGHIFFAGCFMTRSVSVVPSVKWTDQLWVRNDTRINSEKRISRLRSSIFSSVCSGKWQDITTIRPWSLSSKLFPIQQ
jgi:hypothetical protein